MSKSVFIIAVLLLVTAAFGFGCGSAGELAEQASELKDSFDQVKDNVANMQSEIEAQLSKTDEPAEPAPTAPAEIEEPAPPPAEPGMKTITVWLRDGVRDATVNGHALEPGVDNKVEIMTDHPLVAEFDYTDSFGREAHATVDLDSYYDYFVLEELGGWSQTIHPDEYAEVKVTGIR